MHTYTHTHMQTYTHTDIHTYTHTDIQTYTHTYRLDNIDATTSDQPTVKQTTTTKDIVELGACF